MTHIVFEAEPGAQGARPLTIPRPIGRLMALMAVLAVCVAAWYSLRGVKAEVQPLAPVVASRLLTFTDVPGGGLRVDDASTRQLVQAMETNDATFLRALVRAVNGGRAANATVSGATAVLELRQDGQFTVRNPASGKAASVNAFGQTQVSRLFSLMVSRDSATR